jgi:hypothetical protein
MNPLFAGFLSRLGRRPRRKHLQESLFKRIAIFVRDDLAGGFDEALRLLGVVGGGLGLRGIWQRIAHQG